MILRRPTAPFWLLWAGPLLVACSGHDAGSALRSHVVEIRGMEFHPAHLRVSPGDTIVWQNHDFVPHTATAPDSAWTSPPLGQGESWRMVVEEPGLVTYLCAFHPVMQASLFAAASVEEEIR